MLHNPTQKPIIIAAFFLQFTFCCFLFPLLPSPARAQIDAAYSETVLDNAIGSARLSGPSGMSADPQGNLYIADTGNNRIIKFNLEHNAVRETGGFGFKDEEFDRPVDIWAANGLDVWVADYNNRRVKRYDKDLNFVASFASDPAYDVTLQFGYPTAVTLSWQGELFLADHEFNRLLRFDIFGAPKASFGDFSSGAGQLERPAKLLTTHNGEIWASDSLQHAIMRYDAYGNFLGPLGENILARPAGMAEWREKILVADRELRRIVVFDQRGEQLAAFGHQTGRAVKEEPLLEPVDVAVLRERPAGDARIGVSVVVLDAGNNRLQLFTLSMRTVE